jgi:hypothetical protein
MDNYRAEPVPFTGNIFLLIEEIFNNGQNVTNSDIQMQGINEQVLNTQYQQQIAQWQNDADTLKSDVETNTSTSVDPQGIGEITALCVCALATILCPPLGLAFFAIDLTVYASVRAHQEGGDVKKEGDDHWGLTHDTTSTSTNSDYEFRSKQIGIDQTATQQTQQSMSSLVQQFITPDQDMKTQDANEVQAAIQWMKAMVWTQGAA